ncbi:MAG: lipase maturation factor family protein, partial [Limisphaerales bacterium]
AHKLANGEGIGMGRFHLLPTLCWFGASDGFLKFQCGAGCGLALLLMAGVAPPLCLALMWALYLSLTTVGSDFLAFQWDNLLLEAGFLAIFFAPFQWLPNRSRARPPPRLALWLLRVLLFKLMFLSGVVKLTSGDPTWRNLTALSYHYQTQPLPTWIAWYAHQAPMWFQKLSCGLMFAIELVAPWFIFLPRRPRMAAGVALALLQLFILLTGNYTFFNWLTLALCLLLFDDFRLGRLWLREPHAIEPRHPSPSQVSTTPGRFMVISVAIIFLSVSLLQILAAFGPLPRWTSPVVAVYRWLSPFRTVNNYGLFAAMTTERPEIIIEGSTDGREWKEYEFRYKPGNLTRPPQFVAPYQPRLDWQMW